jgi:enoyl-CoA hydratase
VVDNDQCVPEAVKLAQQIAARAPLAVRRAKQAINLAFESSLSAGIAEERRIFYQLFDSKDQKEGMHAFMEKRTASWKGR